MALILNIETSSTVCSVCLAKDGLEVAYCVDRNANSHARVLTLFIEEVLKTSHVKLPDLDAIAVSMGPGSYTGLRIGASVAKGLCYALNKPLIAVPTLQALAEAISREVKSEAAMYMPVIDARRMDMYTALYDNKGEEIRPPFFATINSELENMLSQYAEIWIGGNAAKKCADFFTLQQVFTKEGIDADARLLVNIAEKRFNRKQLENIAYFEPFYLKEFGDKSTS